MTPPEDIPELDVEISVVGPLATVRVAGELDIASAPGFAERLAEAKLIGARQLTIDLARLAFIDSSGLAALAATLKCYREDGGDVVLRSPTRSTAKALEISGLDRVFTVVDGQSGLDGQADTAAP